MGEGEPKHDVVPFGTDCPLTNQLPSYSLTFWKLMSYVGNRLWWLEETALRGECGLIWIGRDSWELSIYGGRWSGRWSTCVSLGSGTLCVRFTGVQLRPAHPLMARLEGHWSTFLLELRVDTLCQNGTKNVLVQMSLREEISAVKSKIIVLKQL